MKLTHTFHKSILRAYDIRGIYNETLFDNDAFFVGRAFGTFLNRAGKKKISIGSDGRVSSPFLKERLIQGLLDSGLEVIDIGVGPTPMLYFSVYHLERDAGIMVTGSHNPHNHNGFKMMLKERPFFGDDILNLGKIAQSGDFATGSGTLEQQDIKQDYVDRLLADCDIAASESGLLDEVDHFEARKKLKIAWDAGNGAAGEIMKMLSDRICAEHILLFEEIDGDFPNHHPDPTVAENLQDLIKCVKENNCDFGIAFDGDGDRIGVVDGEGEILWGDQFMVFFAQDILKENKGATIIADVKASNVLFNKIKEFGGNPIIWKTGHSLIKAKMKETGAALAGEMSGHIFFADKYYGFDDALYAAVRLINILEKSEMSLAEMRKSLPKTFSTPEIRIECVEEQKFEIVESLKKALTKSGIKFDDIDGIRANSDMGWWLIRASNTQPVLVARCEANSLENLKIMKGNIVKNLQGFSVKIPGELK
jgi:phosphomannomutase